MLTAPSWMRAWRPCVTNGNAMADELFLIDTNILVYYLDADIPANKRRVAAIF